VKIDRAKLNTLLRSGLDPEIKTRKQLAARLGLDPTSLTRWFASRDRLGNPRYPVVPDRHVANILQAFNLEPDCLTLEDDKFRQHCFEIALQRAEISNEAKQALRHENIIQRKLTLPVTSTSKKTSVNLYIVASILLVGAGWWWTNSTESEQINSGVTKLNCWTGYSESLGRFEEDDKSDPCHYGKLFHNALEQLKTSNEGKLQPNSTNAAAKEYILFLSKHLEQRRLEEKVKLNIELGRSELNRSNNAAALLHFEIAQEILASEPNKNAKLMARVTAYIATINSTEQR